MRFRWEDGASRRISPGLKKKLSKGVDMRAKRCYNVFMGHSSDYTYP